MARPSKYTPEVVKRIVDALSAGCTRKTAAAFAGVDESTFCRWLHRFADFASSVTLAEASCEVAMVATIRAAAPSDWRAASWWLERRRHQSWGKIDHVEIEIRETAARVAEQTGADPEWLVKRAAEIAVLAALSERQAGGE
jgi:hypothetical protein